MPLPASAAETPRRLFSPIASSYDRPAQLLGLLQYSRWHDFLLSRLDLPPQGHVLDMATGTGALAVRLARLDGLRVTGGDITRRMLLQAAARSNGRGDLVECPAEAVHFAVPAGLWYPLWRLYTAVGLPLGGALLSPAWRRVGSFLGPSIRGFYRRWPEERLLQLWRESGFPDAQAKRLSLGGAIVTWGTKRG